jgi:hypothetical protein
MYKGAESRRGEREGKKNTKYVYGVEDEKGERRKRLTHVRLSRLWVMGGK